MEFLSRYDGRVQSLALGLRKVVHEELAPCHEYIFEMRSKVVLLYGATEHVIRDGICNIGVFAKHVTLGFPRGIDLREGADVLSGTGKGMRHLRITKLSDLDGPALRPLLRQARALSGMKRRRRGSDAEVVTRVKPKRLPPSFQFSSS